MKVAPPDFVAAVGAVDWIQLRSTYESGEIVRDVVLGLASHDGTQVEWAWQQIGETVLQHQGTVYPATAAAAPFLCQLALDDASLSRAVLITELAFLSTGYDEPYAPAGTAMAVRDAVRPYVRKLLRLWGTANKALDMALVALSVAFPAEAEAITPALRDWFGRSAPPLHTGLGLALGFHGLADEAVEQIILNEVGQGEEPAVESPLPDAIQVAERLRAGADERTADFSPVFSFLMTLTEYGTAS